MGSEAELRKAICEVGKRLYAKNLISATDGNISVRLGSGRFLCTPSGAAKGFMKAEDIVVADSDGNKISGDGNVSSEFFTHLAAYERREDVHAVVHAHPPVAVGLTLAGISMEPKLLPELVYSLGGVPTAGYATPGTKEGADAVRELVSRCDALLLDRHGALTLGGDVYDALYKMEKIEHAAQSLAVARLLGSPVALSDDQIGRLAGARKDGSAGGGNI